MSLRALIPLVSINWFYKYLLFASLILSRRSSRISIRCLSLMEYPLCVTMNKSDYLIVFIGIYTTSLWGDETKLLESLFNEFYNKLLSLTSCLHVLILSIFSSVTLSSILLPKFTPLWYEEKFVSTLHSFLLIISLWWVESVSESCFNTEPSSYLIFFTIL